MSKSDERVFNSFNEFYRTYFPDSYQKEQEEKPIKDIEKDPFLSSQEKGKRIAEIIGKQLADDFLEEVNHALDEITDRTVKSN